MIVETEYPGLIPAIERAGHTAQVVCPGCHAPARKVEGVFTTGYVCDSCVIAWATTADIDILKQLPAHNRRPCPDCKAQYGHSPSCTRTFVELAAFGQTAVVIDEAAGIPQDVVNMVLDRIEKKR